MTEERERVTHPSWCERERCTAPEFRPTSGEYSGGAGEHHSKVFELPGYAAGRGVALSIFLSQAVAPWGTGTYLRFEGENEDGQAAWTTEAGQAGLGFLLYELLGEEVKESVREYPTLYAERFPYVERQLQDEADEATADAVMPRDPVELEEQITAEQLADEERAAKGCTHPADETCFGKKKVSGPVPFFRLVVNNREGIPVGTSDFRMVRAAVAELVTARLAEAPDRVAIDAQTINMAFNTGAVEEQLDTEGDWYTVLDAYGEEPLRIRITKESGSNE